MIVVRIIIFLLGLGITLSTLSSAVRATVLPGRKNVRLSRALFHSTFRLFRFVVRHVRLESHREALLAMYAPIATMLLPLTWSILLISGISAMFWAIGVPSIEEVIALSGAALTTQGSLSPQGIAQIVLYIGAGFIGLGIVGLLITFLPTIYAIYSQREQEVTRIAFRFGTPPSGVNVLEHVYRLGLIQEMEQFWHTWEEWFTAMSETHRSNMQVIFYRSSQPDTSWITTAGAILDTCSLFASTVDWPEGPWLRLCFRAGCRTLLDLAANLGRDLAPGVHVARAEYNKACEQLRSADIPLKQDREKSWLTFIQMRSQYAAALLYLADLVYAPRAPWSSRGKESQ